MTGGNLVDETHQKMTSKDNLKKPSNQESDHYWYLATDEDKLTKENNDNNQEVDEEVSTYWDEVWKMSEKRSGER